MQGLKRLGGAVRGGATGEAKLRQLELAVCRQHRVLGLQLAIGWGHPFVARAPQGGLGPAFTLELGAGAAREDLLSGGFDRVLALERTRLRAQLQIALFDLSGAPGKARGLRAGHLLGHSKLVFCFNLLLVALLRFGKIVAGLRGPIARKQSLRVELLAAEARRLVVKNLICGGTVLCQHAAHLAIALTGLDNGAGLELLATGDEDLLLDKGAIARRQFLFYLEFAHAVVVQGRAVVDEAATRGGVLGSFLVNGNVMRRAKPGHLPVQELHDVWHVLGRNEVGVRAQERAQGRSTVGRHLLWRLSKCRSSLSRSWRMETTKLLSAAYAGLRSLQEALRSREATFFCNLRDRPGERISKLLLRKIPMRPLLHHYLTIGLLTSTFNSEAILDAIVIAWDRRLRKKGTDLLHTSHANWRRPLAIN